MIIDQKPVSIIGKDLYGALIMLKSIVDDVWFRSMAIFKRMKVHFVHAADKTYILQFLFSLHYIQDIYLWNMQSKPSYFMFEILT